MQSTHRQDATSIPAVCMQKAFAAKKRQICGTFQTYIRFDATEQRNYRSSLSHKTDGGLNGKPKSKFSDHEAIDFNPFLS